MKRSTCPVEKVLLISVHVISTVFKGGKASCDGTGENDGVKFYRPPVIPRGPFSRQRKPDCQTPQSLLEWKLKQLTAAGVSPLAAAQGNAVVCSTEMPSEGHPPRPEVGWVELWDQRISSLKNQGSQTRIRYLAKGSANQQYSSSGLTAPQNASINMQLPSRETNSYFNSLEQKDLMGYSSPRASSVPIIPSVGLEETCMQMPGISEVKSIKWCKNSYSADIVNVSIPVSDCLIAEQQEVKILLETVQEQIRILTDARRSEDYELASVETEDSVSENTAFLPLSPTAKSEREAQFVLRDEIQRDPALTK
ncbi:Pro-neuregulin-3; membrane-bound isoform [Camelus dromedarius]|uniref:Pro-neuregulin-3 n=1 Tax=Camelus dromedarius TaxID=9838 RepID=A0A5N4DKC1_CAMDR|nr:Pro-neuregulin-3; membrane-bound isoform [Camelus dromedarius]